MSTGKHINKICVAAVILALLLTTVFANGKALGLQEADLTRGYEGRLFDTSKVHTLDIVIDDWDSFIENCESEEYALCAVIIDNESFRNVAIRGKGNTSLSTVSTMGSERYSFKIEFDHYDNTKTYYGLDKLSLNNIIQDNTYMKDYLAYRMMDAFGVDAPLCSYVYITVNGEDWGLYLAVEGVEDSFLRRNYGNEDGDLYKPDSMSFGGGGPGNGRGFDMDEFIRQNTEDSEEGSGTGNMPQMPSGDGSGEGNMPQMPSGDSSGTGNMPQMPSGDSSGTGSMPQMPSGSMPDMSSGEMPDMGNMPDMSNMPEGMSFGDMPDTGDMPDAGDMPDMSNMPSMPGGGGGFGGFGGFGGMGSDDVKLKYIDDDPDSYSNIFNNAKTEVTEKDQSRLIETLQKLSENEDIEEILDVDEVLRYFVVHNFVRNGDSYTGAMIHNYYLYEYEGKLCMIPWDYNLAYGTFQGGNASSEVNAPIDSPVSNSSSGDRPMVDWIFNSEEYTEQYHALFAEFLETVDIQGMIEEAYNLIAPYVEKDPTKFCTTEEFETGVAALKQFCELRSESVQAQLDGEIPSTQEGQNADSSAFIDTTDLNISDMGTMGSTGGKGGQDMGGSSEGGFSMGSSGKSRKGSRQDSEDGQTGEENVPDKADETSEDGQTNIDSQANENSQAGKPGENSGSDQNRKAQQASEDEQNADMPTKPETSGMPEMPGSAENTGTSDIAASSGSTEGSGTSDKTTPTGTAEEPAVSGKPETSESSEEPEISGKPEASESSEKPETSGRPEAPGSSSSEKMQFGDWQGRGDMGMSSGSDTSKALLLGISVLVLAAGILVAAKFNQT